MIAIVDYGVGNLYSLKCSLGMIGAESVVTGDPQMLADADRIILPGVGAFADAIAKLRRQGLDQVVMDEAGRGKPLLGICLGMQMLYEGSREYGRHRGLGLLEGEVIGMADQLKGAPLKVPHMGWNDLLLKHGSPLLANTAAGDFVYFVHSYYAPPSADTVAAVQYGPIEMTAVVQKNNVFGTQFHPEKSGPVGLGILRAFAAVGGR